MRNIERIYNVIYNSVFTIKGSLNYSRVSYALVLLCDEISKIPDDETEGIWYIGEHGWCSLDSLIVGAYWHFSESLQSLEVYESLSDIYTSNYCTGVGEGTSEEGAYNMLEQLRQKKK